MSTTSAPAPDNAPSGPALLRRLLSFNGAQAGAAYRPDVDGLRALAVLPVMLFHAGFAAFPGGYVGVDIFFVLSGYLITGILEREIVAGRFSFVTFYERRARRILPALFAMILATTLSAWIVMLPQDFAEYGRTLWAVLGFVANYFFSAALGDYFATSSEFMPLLHMWSLAVEEQFYLLFPVLLIWLARAGLGGASGTGARLAVVGAICLVSLVLAQVLLARAPTPAFYHTEGRIWELGAGAMLALGLDRWRAPRALREAGAALGLALILGPVFLYGRATPFPGLAALPPVAGAALLLWAGARRRGEEGLPAVNRLLTAPPLVFVGLISYSLYLAHWPIMALLRNFTGFPHLSTRDGAIAVALSLVSATLCWLVVERPFRSRARIGQRGIFVASGLAAAAVAVFAAVLVTGQGLPARFAPNVTLLAHGMEDRNPRAAECFNTWPEGGPCRFGAETAPDAPADLLFWGDSHADALMPGMARAAEMTGRSGLFLGHAGCVPLFDMVRTDEGPWAECDVLYDRLRDLLTARPDIRTVVLYARWSLAYGLARPERGGGADRAA